MSLTYAQLSSAIQAYTQNSETSFVANIPVFVKQAEDRILNAVQLPAFRENVTGTVTASNQYLAIPVDFLAPYSLSVTSSANQTMLLFKSVDFIRESYPSSATTGLPRFYAIFSDSSFILGPTPDSGYTSELHYFRRPETIVTASTSWLGNNAESALLYCSLVEANSFMKGEADVTAMYSTRATEALSQLKMLGDGRMKQDSYRNGESRVPVI